MTSESEVIAQTAVTSGFIAADPTTITLIPRVRTATSTGGWAYVDGAPRAPQLFKMSLLNYDERPTFTLAGGVSRRIDYHIIGMPTAIVELNDYWMVDTDKYEVVGFSEGHDYMVKAFVSVTTPTGKV